MPTPLQKRLIAAGIFGFITLLFIGTTVYQTYFALSVDTLPHQGEIEPFSIPSTKDPDFTYYPTDQDVTVVTFMYTKCPGDQGCALLTSNMASLEDRIKDREWTGVRFLSIDFDYINDTMDDLVQYAETYTNDFDFWKFVLGNETQTQSVADQFYFWFSPHNDTAGIELNHGDKDPYLHMMATYLVDREGTIRKIVQGTNWDYDVMLDSIEFLLSPDWQN